MTRYVAALVTVLDGRVRAAADPRVATRPHAAAAALACTLTVPREQDPPPREEPRA